MRRVQACEQVAHGPAASRSPSPAHCSRMSRIASLTARSAVMSLRRPTPRSAASASSSSAGKFRGLFAGGLDHGLVDAELALDGGTRDHGAAQAADNGAEGAAEPMQQCERIGRGCRADAGASGEGGRKPALPPARWSGRAPAATSAVGVAGGGGGARYGRGPGAAAAGGQFEVPILGQQFEAGPRRGGNSLPRRGRLSGVVRVNSTGRSTGGIAMPRESFSNGGKRVAGQAVIGEGGA